LGDFDVPYVLPPTAPDPGKDAPNKVEPELDDFDVEDALSNQEDIQDFAFLATLKNSTALEEPASLGKDGLDNILFALDAASSGAPDGLGIGADIEDEDVGFDDSLFGHVDIEAGENSILKYDQCSCFVFLC
jgi:hypothetical protein